MYNTSNMFDAQDTLETVLNGRKQSGGAPLGENRTVGGHQDMSEYVQALLDSQLSDRYDMTAFGVKTKASQVEEEA